MQFDRDQLESMRRQLEEDYRLDIAAIERLQRRFSGSASIVSPAAGYLAPLPEPRALEPSIAVETRSEPQPDELTGSLRAMFSTRR